MMQIYGESIALAFKLLFETALKEKTFPDIRKIANVVPVHKTRKKIVKKLSYYRFISYFQQNIQKSLL